MGTSSNIWVKYGNKHFVQHSSYDGQVNNVFAEIGSSVAACGLDSLRKAVQGAQIIIDDGDMDQTRDRGFKLGAAVYIQACQARGRKAFGLLEILRDNIVSADHAHSGVINFFSQPLFHHDGFCTKESESDFVLDLDKGTLRSMFYETDDDWTNGNPTVGFELDLNRVENLNPLQVHLVFHAQDLDSDQPEVQRELLMEDLLGKAERSEGAFPHYHYEREQEDVATASTEPADYAPGEHHKGYHLFMVHPDNGAALRMLVELFQRYGQTIPGLSREDAIKVSMTPGPEGGISLLMDFRSGFANEQSGAATNDFVERVGEMARNYGASYHQKKEGFSRSIARGYMSSSIAIGMDLHDEEEYGASLASLMNGCGPIVPKDAQSVRTPHERREQIEQDAANISVDKEAINRLRFEKMIARADFNFEALALIPTSVDLNKSEVEFSNVLMMNFSSLENKFQPGNRKDRFCLIDHAQRQEIYNSLTQLDRYIFTEELGIEIPSNPSKTHRP